MAHLGTLVGAGGSFGHLGVLQELLSLRCSLPNPAWRSEQMAVGPHCDNELFLPFIFALLISG